MGQITCIIKIIPQINCNFFIRINILSPTVLYEYLIDKMKRSGKSKD